MEFNPRVSIVIPVYNGSNYLREAIDSALAQTYRNIEVLVINDGSDDYNKTEEIAKSYGDRIRYFHKENGGVSSALNLGIQEMTGEYFSWLSHDDVYMPKKIENQITFLKENQKIRAVTCNFEIIDESGKTIDTYINSSRPEIKNGRDVLETWIYGCALLINKECFETVGLFNVDNKTTQDIEMWLKIVRHYPIVFQQDLLCKCRKHSQCGSIRNIEQQNKYLYYLYNIIFQEFDISFFFLSDETNADSARLRAKTYNWLGNNALTRGADEGAELCYQHALKAYNSLLNPVLYKNLIGIKKWAYIKRLDEKAKGVAYLVIKSMLRK